MFIFLLLLLIPNIANAEYLGCFEPNEAVEIKSLFLDATGARVDPTSLGCEIFDPNDTTATACTSGPTKIGSITGWYESSHTMPASPLAGTWYAKTNGTIAGVVHEGTDTFHVVDTAGDCASRTGVTVTSLANDSITAAAIAAGALGGASETYLVTGTEGAGTSTTTLIYTSLSVVSTKKYSGMCLWAASNDERRLIISVGDGVFTVRGFSVAPTNGTELRIYSGGCN